MKQKSKLGVKSHHTVAPLAFVAIIIALPEERDYFHSIIADRPRWRPKQPRGEYFAELLLDSEGGTDWVQVIVKTCSGMGQLETVLAVQSVCARFPIDAIFMVGIAGSLHPKKVRLCDVVVSNKVKYFASDKGASLVSPYRFGEIDDLGRAQRGEFIVDKRDRFLDGSFLRYARDVVSCDSVDLLLSDVEEELASEAKAMTFEHSGVQVTSGGSVHFGWLLSLNHVVDSEEYRNYLVEKNEHLALDIHRQKGEAERARWERGEILAVDMETYGLFKGANNFEAGDSQFSRTRDMLWTVSIRGISDECSGKGELDSKTGLQVRRNAMANAASVCLKLIESIDWVRASRL